MKKILCAVSVLFLLGTISAYAEIVIIANSGANVTAIDQSVIKDIYTGKKTVWDDGSRIAFFTMEEGQTQQAFLQQFVKKSQLQYNNFWRRELFLGKAAGMPPSCKTTEEMIQNVSSTPNSIGFISSDKDLSDANVKKIQIIK